LILAMLATSFTGSSLTISSFCVLHWRLRKEKHFRRIDRTTSSVIGLWDGCGRAFTFTLRAHSDWPGDGEIRTEREIVACKLFHSGTVHHEHGDVRRLAANLGAEGSAVAPEQHRRLVYATHSRQATQTRR
jgi:hypothetical protein